MRKIIPEIPKGLLEHLEEAFPDTLPEDPEFSERDLAASIGAQKVIRHLRSIHQYQQQEQDGSGLWDALSDSL